MVEQLKINVFYMGGIYAATGKEMEILEVEDDITVRRLLFLLVRQYGERFKEAVMDLKSTMERPWLKVIVSVNGKALNALDGLDTVLRNGDSMAFMTMVSGG